MNFIPNPLIIPVGIVIGILVSAPVGPVNVLCIQRAVSRGFWGGMMAGLGAALGDGTIAFFAALGVGAISGLVDTYRAVIQTVGGLVLIVFGVRLWVADPAAQPLEENGSAPGSIADYAWDVPKTFFLTITNPGAVLGLFAIFGGVSTFVSVTRTADALLMVAAIMAGSMAWWFTISQIAGYFRHKLSVQRLHQINQVAGLLLIAFGIVLIGEIVLGVV